MRMHHGDSLIHFPLAALWVLAGWSWSDGFQAGSNFFHTLLPYLGVAAATLQVIILIRKLWRGSRH